MCRARALSVRAQRYKNRGQKNYCNVVRNIALLAGWEISIFDWGFQIDRSDGESILNLKSRI